MPSITSSPPLPYLCHLLLAPLLLSLSHLIVLPNGVTSSFIPAQQPSVHKRRCPVDSSSVMTMKLDKGFNLLETASKLVPQGQIVNTAKETWKFAWGRMMAELAPQDKTGSYQRPSYGFDGQIGDANFPDEPQRYHLYIGNPCPWCHRAKLALNLCKVTPNEISTTLLIDDPIKASRGGWIIPPSDTNEPLGVKDLREVYDCLSPNYKGRCTAPLLIDKKSRKIVCNESSLIVKSIAKATFQNQNKAERMDLYPSHLMENIEQTNEWVYRLLNNGVYRCGFATSQAAYNGASKDVLQGLNKANDILSKNTFLCGEVFTESDLRLLPTILRYDGAYGPLFKAGGVHLKIRDFEHIHKWLRLCWNMEGGAVQESIDLEDANGSYWKQLFPLNAGGIIPRGVSAKEIGLE